MGKNLLYTMYERIGDTWQFDGYDKTAYKEQEVIALMATMCCDFEAYTIEINCEAIVLWLNGKIAAVALNDNEPADATDAEQYLRTHERS